MATKQINFEVEYYENPNDNTDYYFRVMSNDILIDKFPIEDVESIITDYLNDQKRFVGRTSAKELHKETFDCSKEEPCGNDGCPYGDD